MPAPEYNNLIYIEPHLQPRDVLDTVIEYAFSRLAKVETDGTEENIPTSGNLVIGFMPHSGFVEPPLIDKYLLKRGRKPAVIITKKETQEMPDIILSPRRMIYIDRSNPEITTMKAIKRILSTPDGMIMSALEGTRFSNPTDPDDVLTLGETKPGLMRLAYESRAPIMGVAILGLDKVLPALDKVVKQDGMVKTLELLSQAVIHPVDVQIRFLPPYTGHLSDEGRKMRGIAVKEYIDHHNRCLTRSIVEEIVKMKPDYPLGPYGGTIFQG